MGMHQPLTYSEEHSHHISPHYVDTELESEWIVSDQAFHDQPIFHPHRIKLANNQGMHDTISCPPKLSNKT